MRILFKHIKALLQVRNKTTTVVKGQEMGHLPKIDNAYLVVEGDTIAAFGSMENCPQGHFDKVIDTSGKMILPAWCDSHTHLVYAGNREQEFIDRINGLTYSEIAERGGGILNSAEQLQNITEEELYQQSKVRLEKVMALGTGAIEIKSGYGLTPAAELKMLRVIQRLKNDDTLPIKATFLAAHALPFAYKNDKVSYIDKMLSDTLPTIAKEKLASYIDVFCEQGYFSVQDTEHILEEGKKIGLIPKVHVNQFNAMGGVAAAVKHNALTADHLELITEDDLNALRGKNTLAVALPLCSFFLDIPYTPARKLIEAGVAMAIATDYNPGSAPSGNMNLAVSMACIKLRMTPEEAINAATINGAYAMGLANKVGSITVGKRANLLITRPIHSYAALPYSFGMNQIDAVYNAGVKIA